MGDLYSIPKNEKMSSSLWHTGIGLSQKSSLGWVSRRKHLDRRVGCLAWRRRGAWNGWTCRCLWSRAERRGIIRWGSILCRFCGRLVRRADRRPCMTSICVILRPKGRPSDRSTILPFKAQELTLAASFSHTCHLFLRWEYRYRHNATFLIDRSHKPLGHFVILSISYSHSSVLKFDIFWGAIDIVTALSSSSFSSYLWRLL